MKSGLAEAAGRHTREEAGQGWPLLAAPVAIQVWENLAW